MHVYYHNSYFTHDLIRDNFSFKSLENKSSLRYLVSDKILFYS